MTVDEFRRQIRKGKFFGTASLNDDCLFEANLMVANGVAMISVRGCKPTNHEEEIVYGRFDDAGEWLGDKHPDYRP